MNTDFNQQQKTFPLYRGNRYLIGWQLCRERQRSGRGFTLIELVVVIVLLGILSSFAASKYSEIRSDATRASTVALAGALQSASDLVHTGCLTKPSCNAWGGGSSTFTYGGQTYCMWKGYIDAGDNIGGCQVDQIISTSGFNISITLTKHHFTHTSAIDPSNCYAEYTEVMDPSKNPSIATVTSGC